MNTRRMLIATLTLQENKMTVVSLKGLNYNQRLLHLILVLIENNQLEKS
jgi:hypothetical protein